MRSMRYTSARYIISPERYLSSPKLPRSSIPNPGTSSGHMLSYSSHIQGALLTPPPPQTHFGFHFWHARVAGRRIERRASC